MSCSSCCCHGHGGKGARNSSRRCHRRTATSCSTSTRPGTSTCISTSLALLVILFLLVVVIFEVGSNRGLLCVVLGGRGFV